MIDPENIAALPATESCLVQAGPGTGKTRLLANRLKFLLQNQVRPAAGIACITYTNAAADEICRRLDPGVRPAFLGTIHSFLLEYLVYPYGYWIEGIPVNFDLVTEGFAIPHLRWMEANGLIDRRKAHVPDVCSAFESIGYDLRGNPVCFTHNPLKPQEMRAFIDRRLSHGQISQHDVLWIAWQILADQRYKHVLDALSCRFYAILVDEFQDTTELQYAILKKIYSQGRTTLFIVGDPEQSIFSFAGTDSGTYRDATAEFTSYSLNSNYRSTRFILDFINIFVSSDRHLIANGSWKNDEIPVHLLIDGDDDRLAIDFFAELRKQYGIRGGEGRLDYLILARDARHVRKLESNTIGHDVDGEDFFEKLQTTHPQLCSILKDVFRARRLLDLGEYARAFRSIDRGLSRLILKCNPGFGSPAEVGLTRYSWRIMLCDVLRNILSMESAEVRQWVTGLSEVIKNAVLHAGGIKAGRKLTLLGKLADKLPKKIKYHASDCVQAVEITEEIKNHVRTIHRAKGLEAEAVLVFASRAAQLTEWVNPHGSGRARTENARIGYVAFSRAMKLLCIATPAVSQEVDRTLSSCGSVKVIRLV